MVWSDAARVGLFALLVVLILGALLLLARRLGPRRVGQNQDIPFESGLGRGSRSHPPLQVAFYLLAVSFLVFELEGAFLFAWAVAFHTLPVRAVVGGLFFLLILALGWVYEWRMGALRWH